MPARPRVYAYRESDRWSRTISSSRPAARITATSGPGELPAAVPGEDRPGRPARPAGAAPRSSRRRKPTPEAVEQGDRRQQHRVGVRARGTGSPGAGRGRQRRAAAAGTQKSGGDRVEQVRLDGRRRRRPPAPSRAAAATARRCAATAPGVRRQLARGGGRGCRCGRLRSRACPRISAGAHSATGSRPGRAPAGRCRRARRRAVVGRPRRRCRGRRAGRRSATRGARAAGRGRRRRSASASACAAASGRRAERLQVGVARVVAGQLGEPALGVRLARRPDALLDLLLRGGGEVVELGRAASVHAGQVEPGDLTRDAPEDGDAGRRRWRPRSTAAGCSVQPTQSPPPSTPSSTTTSSARSGPGALRAGRRRRRRPPARLGRGRARRRRAPRRGPPGSSRRPRWPCPGRGRRRRRRSGAASTMSCVGGVGDDHGDVVRAAAAQRELRPAARRTGCGSAYSRRVSPMVSALTTPERPSLQIR